MRICLISHEYPPFPGGGIATYTEAAARALAARGHDVHVITNRARYGSTEPAHSLPLWQDGDLTVHRLQLHDENRVPPRQARFLDVDLHQYPDHWNLWASDPSNMGANLVAAYVQRLHRDLGFDVIEVPEYYAEAFYIIRRRRCGHLDEFPPVCVISHTSSRELLSVSRLTNELGRESQRRMMWREEYCVQYADALQTPSRSLMERYVQRFGGGLPPLREVIRYYLEVPEQPAPVPPEYRSKTGPAGSYLVCTGRIEPRKGSDVAVRAFAQLADDHPDLRLVLLGREAWRDGESFSALFLDPLPASIRNRVVRMGNVPREVALGIVRDSAAFVHPAPWDNYPSAVLEAMAVGAACVVSDTGGHAEMIEDGKSGLHVPIADPRAVADAVRRVLADDALCDSLRREARIRVREISDADRVTAGKLELFERMVERKGPRAASPPSAPPFLVPDYRPPALPGSGIIVVDVGNSDPAVVETTIASITDEASNSPEWRVVAMTELGQDVRLPSGWQRAHHLDTPPWIGLPEDSTTVYVKAQVRFDRGRLADVVHGARARPEASGAFAWLRPANVQRFPFASDQGAAELGAKGSLVAPVFAIASRHLQAFDNLAGLARPEPRIVALMTATAIRSELVFLHTGAVCGDFYGELPTVTRFVQDRVAGFLEACGLLSGGITTMLSIATDRLMQGGNGEAQHVVSGTTIDPGELAELRRIRDEHHALKRMGIVRLLRSLRVFDLARKIVPKSSKALGTGKR